MDVDAVARLVLHAEVLGGHLVHIEHGHANFLHHDMTVSRCAHRSVINHAIQNRGIRNQIRIVAVAAGCHQHLAGMDGNLLSILADRLHAYHGVSVRD